MMNLFNRLFSIRILDADIAALLLRLLFGGLFTYYGWLKYEMYDTMVKEFPDLIGLGGQLSYHLVLFAELFCGIFVFIGLATRITVIPIFITMYVAYFYAHTNDPFLQKQIVFVHLILAVIIFITGSGKFSVDRLLFKRKN